MNVKALIAQLFEQDILITPEQAKLITDEDANILSKMLGKPVDIEAYLTALAGGGKKIVAQPPQVTNPISATKPNGFIPVQILRHYNKKPKKRSYADFVAHFNSRFQAMEKILRQRKELQNVTSIDRTRQYAGRDTKQKVSLIGLVLEKRETKNGHLIIELEDRSGSINILFAKGKPLFESGKDLCNDEIIGITGTLGDGIVFADEVYLPSVPVHNELKHAPDDVYAICISDIHFGNKNFFEKEFKILLDWLRGEAGTPEARAIAKKVQYIFIPGDLVEGVGIYPAQENDLSIQDIYSQYRYCDEVLDRIPNDKHILIIPGNHDIGRLSEPQPALSKEVLPRLAARDNVYFLSNPSTVKIHQTPDFDGFTCLLYHGGSLIYYGNTIMHLFQEGGMSNPCAVMQYLLQRRHLAPSHTATLYVPDNEEDPLILHEIPDFFITGHLHTTQEKTWNGITMLSCSCWVPMTEYQMKQGLKIDPGKFMLINLKTRQVEAIKPEDLI